MKDADTGNGHTPHRVGLLGAGYVASYHARALHLMKGVELVAVADPALERAQALAAAWGARAYPSAMAMLGNEQLNAVHVLVPPDGHYEASVTALAAGVPVFLEKPMCARASECAQLVQLAARRGLRVAVGHNFLFAEPYERLRRDLAAGVFGPLDSVTVTWNKELAQLAGGPFDAWMLRRPENIMVEVGPHLVAHVLDMLHQQVTLQVQASQPLELPTGVRFWRRWRAHGEVGGTAIELRVGFGPGFTEHQLHVRGRLAAATVDFERNTYLLHHHRPLAPDFDRLAATHGEAAQACRQAWATMAGYVSGKAKLSRQGGTPYARSIQRAAEAFYRSLAGEPDPRISASLAQQAVEICEALGGSVRQEARSAGAAPRAPAPVIDLGPGTAPTTLVLGASGFIGRELVRQCIEANRPVRLLVRSPSRLRGEAQAPGVQLLEGDLNDPADLGRAMVGIKHVVHLARANVKTWEEYQKYEIEMTRRVAQACRAAGAARLVYTGTIDAYYAGDPGERITEDTPLDPQIAQRNLYARAKAESEKLLLEEHHRNGLPVVIVRPGIVIGRGGSPFHWGVGMWHENAVCQTWGEGRNKLPLVLVEDVARGILRALATPGIEGQSFNLVGEPCLSAQEYLDELERAAGLHIQRRATPIGQFFAADLFKWAVKVAVRFPDRRVPSYRDWQSRSQSAHFDCSKAKQQLGWRPESVREEICRRGIQLPVAEWLGLAADPTIESAAV